MDPKAEAHRWALARVREALRFSTHRRDRGVPAMAELQNFAVPGAAGPLDARLYVPKDAGSPGPLLLYFHGGGFITCDIDTHDAMCARLAQASGVRILSCNYRLAPEAPFPAQLDDALAIARWVDDHREALGADRLLVGGDSAGGYLAAATAGRMPRTFMAQVLIYPLLHVDDDGWATSVLRDSRVVGRLAVQYIDAMLAQDGVRAPSLLAKGALAPLPSVIVTCEALDPCRPEADAARDLLQAAGAKVLYTAYPHLAHGFGNLTHALSAARRAIDDIGRMVREIL